MNNDPLLVGTPFQQPVINANGTLTSRGRNWSSIGGSWLKERTFVMNNRHIPGNAGSMLLMQQREPVAAFPQLGIPAPPAGSIGPACLDILALGVRPDPTAVGGSTVVGTFGVGIAAVARVGGQFTGDSGVIAAGGSGHGVWGRSTGFMGVFGDGPSGIAWPGVGGAGRTSGASGVQGWGFGNGAGVRGIEGGAGGGAGWAGLFEGFTEVRGTFKATRKDFKIDHPLDPRNKYLQHTSVESPDMKNVYDGVEQLDEDGAAWVELPEWFEALNRDYRYQLTAIGGPAPELHIAEEIAENRFRIAGGKEGMRVSWQVTGVRKDEFAEENPLEVELEKTEEDREALRLMELTREPPTETFGIPTREEVLEEVQARIAEQQRLPEPTQP